VLTAIIVAAGHSRRMGFDKLFAMLDGKPVVAQTIAVFERTGCVDDIILIGRKDRLRELKEIVQTYAFKKIRHVVGGGDERQDSVRAGLDLLKAETKYVAVQDAARPLSTPELIERVFANAQAHGGAASAAAIIDTVKRADRDCVVSESVDRECLYAVQSPQIFRCELLIKAYQSLFEEKSSITDDVSAVERIGEKVMLVPNEDLNFKITYPADLPLAEFILRQRRGIV
jgi:2-C-methyl-D-erythritol 4-phosphate cytidylyltransferase